MRTWSYTRGLHDLGNSVYAYLQPEGSWGWSNAGLVVDGEASLLIDTLFDLKLTQEMLDTMRKSVPAAADIDMVVNTHANGDHCYGNQLVADAQIIASKNTAAEMAEVSPQHMAMLLKNAPQLGLIGAFVTHAFGAFDFEGITITLRQELRAVPAILGDAAELREVPQDRREGDAGGDHVVQADLEVIRRERQCIVRLEHDPEGGVLALLGFQRRVSAVHDRELRAAVEAGIVRHRAADRIAHAGRGDRED